MPRGREVEGQEAILVFICPELLGAVVKQFLVHLHEELQSVVYEPMDGPEGTTWMRTSLKNTNHHGTTTVLKF